MPQPPLPDQLRWIPGAVANLTANHGIDSRNALAKVLNCGRSAIYESFNEDWSGTATITILVRMCRRFGVPMHHLVIEPCVEQRHYILDGATGKTAGKPAGGRKGGSAA